MDYIKYSKNLIKGMTYYRKSDKTNPFENSVGSCWTNVIAYMLSDNSIKIPDLNDTSNLTILERILYNIVNVFNKQ